MQGHILNEKLEFKDLLENYSVNVGILAWCAGIILFGGMLFRFHLEDEGYIVLTDSQRLQDKSLYSFLFKQVIMMLTLIIGIIPEALSLAVIYCVSAYASLDIFNSGSIIFRRLKSLENMGRVNCLCLEK